MSGKTRVKTLLTGIYRNKCSHDIKLIPRIFYVMKKDNLLKVEICLECKTKFKKEGWKVVGRGKYQKLHTTKRQSG